MLVSKRVFETTTKMEIKSVLGCEATFREVASHGVQGMVLRQRVIFLYAIREVSAGDSLFVEAIHVQRFGKKRSKLQHKIKNIEDGIAFVGKSTKAAKFQGKKIYITIEKEYFRLLGNLA